MEVCKLRGELASKSARLSNVEQSIRSRQQELDAYKVIVKNLHKDTANANSKMMVFEKDSARAKYT